MKAKQKVIDKLKGKTAQNYYEDYCEAELKLCDALKELKNFGDECKCDCGGESVILIHKGEFNEMMEYCLNCGGYIQEREWG